MSELCVLAAVSLVVAQADQIDQFVDGATIHQPREERAEIEPDDLHCTSPRHQQAIAQQITPQYHDTYSPSFSTSIAGLFNAPEVSDVIVTHEAVMLQSLEPRSHWNHDPVEHATNPAEHATNNNAVEERERYGRSPNHTTSNDSRELAASSPESSTTPTHHRSRLHNSIANQRRTNLDTTQSDQTHISSQPDESQPFEESSTLDARGTRQIATASLRQHSFNAPSLPPSLQPSPTPFTHQVVEPLHDASTLASINIPATKALRPSSGRQFYRQRRTALQAGQSYTRISTDQFSDEWLPSTYEPSHEDWVSLLSREAWAMSAGQGTNRLTVMIGDSISLWFPTEYMPRHRFWLNQSISGDTAAGTLHRLDLFSQTNPDIIHVMIGINDLRGGATDQQLLETQRRIIRRLRQQHPEAQVVVHSLLPTRMESLPSDRIRRINQQLGAIATQEGAQLLDLHRYFIDDAGQMNAALTTDGLHLNSSGYALWYRVLSQMRLV